MHNGLTFNSWFVWVMWGFFAAVLLGAIAVVVSTLRRPEGDFGALGRAPWLVVQTALLAVSAFVVIAGAFDVPIQPGPTGLAVMGVFLVVAAVQQIAYLLRVVFPSPKRRASRTSSSDGDPGESVAAS